MLEFLLALTLAACSAPTDASSNDSASLGGNEQDAGDSGEPCAGRAAPLDGLSVAGSDGLRLDVLSVRPDPPAIGDNGFMVELRRDGEPLDGVAAAITVSPRMPDHGEHGTPVTVEVTALGAGEYEFAPVNTFMPGFWVVTVDIDSDAVSGAVQFGVCIE
jgi:hypothetical protein